jgi:hypothetical protein
MSADATFPTLDPELASIERILGAQYTVLRPLGRGGMGVVYLARERLLDRLVAIKVLRSDRADDEARDRFLQEARTAARLTHPNIVPLLSFGQSEDAVFYVMGYVDGESLEAQLRRTGRIDSDTASRMLAELAGALDYAHRNGVVHRDIKPDNILLDRVTGRAMLTDFGIAKMTNAASALTKTGMIVGTPHYMSPEQGAGDRAIDGRSDIYSLGIVAYRMLAGRLPFETTNLQELLAAHAARTPASLSGAAPDLDAALASTIMRCLEKDPQYRWPSAGALRTALESSAGAGITLPDGIDHLPSRAIKLGIGFYAAEIVALATYGARGTADWLVIAGVLPVMYAIALSPTFYLARKVGVGFRSALRLMFLQPSWWSGWWPRWSRNPGDVFDRLPREIRDLRTASAAATALMFLVTTPITVPWVIRGLASPDPRGGTLALAATGATILIPIIGLALPAVRFRRWAKKTALPRKTAEKMMYERTFNSPFWARDDIAPLLGPALAIPMSDTPPRSVIALVADIERAIPDLARFDAPLAGDVRAALTEIAGRLAEIEPEIDHLAQHRDDGEIERLATRLRDMRNSDDPALRQMRELVLQQLELTRGLERRQRDLEERYETWIARLHTMWLQLRMLRAQRVAESSEAAEITGRIRALCANVGHLNAAIEEVNVLTQLPGERSTR